MLRWLPVIGPWLCEFGQKKAAGQVREEIAGTIRRLLFWIAVLLGTATISLILDVRDGSRIVGKAIVIAYTVEGAILVVGATRRARADLVSWPARLFDVGPATIVRAGGLPLASAFVIYTLVWGIRCEIGNTVVFCFWGWMWRSLVG